MGPRLEAVASFIPRGARVADIGTDHGLLPVWLSLHGGAEAVIAADIRPGPLSAAKQNAERYGVGGIRFCLCSGLSGIFPREVDHVVIAGMGGETILSILQDAGWDWTGKKLILEANTKYPELLTWLYAANMHVDGEAFAEERGRLYRICSVACGHRELPGKAFLWGGFRDGAYAERQAKLIRDALPGLRQASSVADRERLREYESILEEMKDAYHWRDPAGSVQTGSAGEQNGL